MIHHNTIRRAILLAGLLTLGGCSIYSMPGDSEPAPVENKQPDYSATPGKPPATPAPPATMPPEPNDSNAYGGLLAKASEARDRGDYEQALALLERAQRIDPDSGEIYLALAQTYQAKGATALASSTAERGLLYCQGSRECNALRAYIR